MIRMCKITSVYTTLQESGCVSCVRAWIYFKDDPFVWSWETNLGINYDGDKSVNNTDLFKRTYIFTSLAKVYLDEHTWENFKMKAGRITLKNWRRQTHILTSLQATWQAVRSVAMPKHLKPRRIMSLRSFVCIMQVKRGYNRDLRGQSLAIRHWISKQTPVKASEWISKTAGIPNRKHSSITFTKIKIIYYLVNPLLTTNLPYIPRPP